MFVIYNEEFTDSCDDLSSKVVPKGSDSTFAMNGVQVLKKLRPSVPVF